MLSAGICLLAMLLTRLWVVQDTRHFLFFFFTFLLRVFMLDWGFHCYHQMSPNTFDLAYYITVTGDLQCYILIATNKTCFLQKSHILWHNLNSKITTIKRLFFHNSSYFPPKPVGKETNTKNNKKNIEWVKKVSFTASHLLLLFDNDFSNL